MGTFKKAIWQLIKKKAWYLILLIASSLYVWHYRLEIYQLKELNVRNLIFILWLFLLLCPLFSEMELLGVKVKKEIEKATGEFKDSLAEVRMQLMDLKISNSNANTIYIGEALVSKEQLNKLLENVEATKEGTEKANTKTDDSSLNKIEICVPEQNVYLFEVRLSLENLVSKICEKTGYVGNQLYTSKIDHLSRIGFLSTETAKIISQIWTIANRGIHGEIVSTEYIEFVKKAVPMVFKVIKDGDQALNYCVCPRCKYKGYAVFENVCPRCGNVFGDD